MVRTCANPPQRVGGDAVPSKDDSIRLQFLQQVSQSCLQCDVIAPVKPDFFQRSVIRPKLSELSDNKSIVLLLSHVDLPWACLARDNHPTTHTAVAVGSVAVVKPNAETSPSCRRDKRRNDIRLIRRISVCLFVWLVG